MSKRDDGARRSSPARRILRELSERLGVDDESSLVKNVKHLEDILPNYAVVVSNLVTDILRDKGDGIVYASSSQEDTRTAKKPRRSCHPRVLFFPGVENVSSSSPGVTTAFLQRCARLECLSAAATEIVDKLVVDILQGLESKATKPEMWRRLHGR